MMVINMERTMMKITKITIFFDKYLFIHIEYEKNIRSDGKEAKDKDLALNLPSRLLLCDLTRGSHHLLYFHVPFLCFHVSFLYFFLFAIFATLVFFELKSPNWPPVEPMLQLCVISFHSVCRNLITATQYSRVKNASTCLKRNKTTQIKVRT